MGKKYHMISAKKQGWKPEYDYCPFPTDKYTKEEALAQFKLVKKETLKNNNRYYPYTAYENNGITYYSIRYEGVYDEQELLDRGFTKNELNQL